MRSSVGGAALVFFTSASILVLEILAGRILAPFVGVTLETFTGIIGTVLAGIAVGAWLGGIARNLLRDSDRKRTRGRRLTLVGDQKALDVRSEEPTPVEETSPVLEAIGFPEALRDGVLRLSLCGTETDAELERAAAAFRSAAAALVS